MLVEQERCCTDVSQIEVYTTTSGSRLHNSIRSPTLKLDNKSNANYTVHMQQRTKNNGHKVYESGGRVF